MVLAIRWSEACHNVVDPNVSHCMLLRRRLGSHVVASSDIINVPAQLSTETGVTGGVLKIAVLCVSDR